MTNAKKTLLSGIKPSGTLHIGNYFGAIQQFVAMQEEYDEYLFLADFHALTTVQNAEELQTLSLQTAAGYIAAGIDPDKVILYKQSDVPEVTELAWIFNCITTMPYLMRAHAFKDAQAKNKEINVGVFDYPILMAADILIQQADVVPVGQDQKQHVEIARDTALKFNNVFGEVFTVPQEKISPEVAVVPGTDGRKMSKSYGNIIPLFASKEELAKAVMGIVTDSTPANEPKDPDKDTVFAYHRLFSQSELAGLSERYRTGNIGYKESKELLLNNMEKVLSPMRGKYNELMDNPDNLRSILRTGGERARNRAQETLARSRKIIGLTG